MTCTLVTQTNSKSTEIWCMTRSYQKRWLVAQRRVDQSLDAPLTHAGHLVDADGKEVLHGCRTSSIRQPCKDSIKDARPKQSTTFTHHRLGWVLAVEVSSRNDEALSLVNTRHNINHVTV